MSLYRSQCKAVKQDELDFTGINTPDDIGVHAADKDMTPAEQFEYWKTLPGSRQILRAVYRHCARYGKRYERTGRQVSVRLIWHLVRDEVNGVRERCKRRGVDLRKWKGFTLNNSLTPAVARHIISRRPDWEGMFELRERKSE